MTDWGWNEWWALCFCLTLFFAVMTVLIGVAKELW